MLKKRLNSEDLNLIGKDVTSWTQAIRRGYTLSFLLYAFHETGVFEYLKDQKPKSAKQIAKKCNLEQRVLESGLNFFLHSDTSIEKDSMNRYFITNEGKNRIFADQTVAMALGAVGAYHPLFTHLIPALRKQEVYGKDFKRDGGLIAKASYLTGKGSYDWVIRKLEELKVKTVVDLGCGSGDILINFCKSNNKIKGIGIDISEEALKEAKERIQKAELQSRIGLIKGDMVSPSSYSKKIKSEGPDLAFNAIMSLHEFLRDGQEAVVEILKRMKREFKDSYLLLGEFDKIKDSEFKKMSLAEKMHMLFYQEIIHGMTPQGLADKETWIKMLKEAKLEIIEIKDDLPFRLVEYVTKF